MVHDGSDSVQFPTYQTTNAIDSWARPQKCIDFDENRFYRFRVPRIQKRKPYRMDCPRLGLFFFENEVTKQQSVIWEHHSVHVVLMPDLGLLNLRGAPPLFFPKSVCKLYLGCSYSVLSVFLDFSWVFIFFRSHRKDGGWEPDSVPIKSGPPTSNWNFHGEHSMYRKRQGEQF